MCRGGGGKGHLWGKFHLLRINLTFSQGDSGGPLYMRYVIEDQKKSAYHDNSKPWYLLGIVSFGSKRCGVGYPAIYTRYKNIKHINVSLPAIFRVESFIPWIRENIKD